MKNPFHEHLLDALEHVNDPEWLGTHSPLAMPYFLGEYLEPQTSGDLGVTRGRALQSLLHHTVRDLGDKGEEGQYLRQILELTFFHPHASSVVAEELHISRATYYRHRTKALEQAETGILQHLKPALRLEKPPLTGHEIVGRERALVHCLQALEAGQSTAVTGISGVGKTTLGAQIGSRWTHGPVFWFTLRPGLNDHLESILFSLSYFLQRQGKPQAWLQLVATAGSGAGTIDFETVLALIRQGLVDIQAKAIPLLCFDEVDLLRPLETERHARIVSFLSSLDRWALPLFMGQQIPVQAEFLQPLPGLSTEEISQLLAAASVHLPTADLARLQTYTRGNPRLLELFTALHHSGEVLNQVLEQMSTAPSVEFLLTRLWQRLDEGARQLLSALSVFRQPAPHDFWPDPDVVTSLVARRLVHTDAWARLSILPAFHSIIYRRLLPEARETLHQQAATVRAERGEYTAAAYHYIRAGKPGTGVQLWYAHRRQEINQGQGTTALKLFEEVSANQVNAPTRETLLLLRNELRMLVGAYEEVRADLQARTWRTPLAQARADRIAGDAAYEQSEFQTALEAYQQGLQLLEPLEIELSLFHKEMGKVSVHQRDLESAWRKALLAQYEVENLKGNIEGDRGNLTQARHHYEIALALAEELDYVEGEGKTRNNLAWVLKQQGDFTAANQHWEQASACYERVGRVIWQAGIKVNQGVAHTESAEPEAAVPLLKEALAVFETVGHTRGRAIANANLAEAYLAQARLEEANRFAWAALADEEPVVMAATYNTLAEIRLAAGQLAEADDYCDRSLALARSSEDRVNYALSWRTAGKIYHRQDRVEAAAEALDKARTVFEELGMAKEVEVTRSLMKELLGNGGTHEAGF